MIKTELSFEIGIQIKFTLKDQSQSIYWQGGNFIQWRLRRKGASNATALTKPFQMPTGDIIEGQKNEFILALKHLRGSVRQRILPTSSAIIEPIPSTVNQRGNFWCHCQSMKIFLTHRSRSNEIQTRRPSGTQGKQVHHNTVRLSGVSSDSIMPKRKALSMARLQHSPMQSPWSRMLQVEMYGLV